MNNKIQETPTCITNIISEQIARRIEGLATYFVAIIAEKDREIEGLRGSLKQASQDFLTSNEKLKEFSDHMNKNLGEKKESK